MSNKTSNDQVVSHPYYTIKDEINDRKKVEEIDGNASVLLNDIYNVSYYYSNKNLYLGITTKSGFNIPYTPVFFLPTKQLRVLLTWFNENIMS